MTNSKPRASSIVLIALDNRSAMYFHCDLLDLLPIVFLDTRKHIELTAFNVDLQQVDPLDLLLANDFGERLEPATVVLAAQVFVEQFVQL